VTRDISAPVSPLQCTGLTRVHGPLFGEFLTGLDSVDRAGYDDGGGTGCGTDRHGALVRRRASRTRKRFRAVSLRDRISVTAERAANNRPRDVTPSTVVIPLTR
jgi:hypothetical protein